MGFEPTRAVPIHSLKSIITQYEYQGPPRIELGTCRCLSPVCVHRRNVFFGRGLTRRSPIEYLTFLPISAIFQSFWPSAMTDEKVFNVTHSREPCRKRALKCRVQINYTHARRVPVALTQKINANDGIRTHAGSAHTLTEINHHTVRVPGPSEN